MRNDTQASGGHRVLDPCLPQGYDGLLNGVAVSGGGYFSRCREASSQIVAGDCAEQHCGLRGLHVPPLAGVKLTPCICKFCPFYLVHTYPLWIDTV